MLNCHGKWVGSDASLSTGVTSPTWFRRIRFIRFLSVPASRQKQHSFRFADAGWESFSFLRQI
ncbi:hypothetical protein GMO_10650 [Gluconobacter morbifer G707]|uniref:Uncharacterized protein n=1 Tax=Gluconobacter morbifer G707 TaxID=1088869 RepID=G6XHS1_9PROT|nr:hypothetical protein GMO_10650 [Gluconobacter morbifer G707]